jgi:hypothetical protein
MNDSLMWTAALRCHARGHHLQVSVYTPNSGEGLKRLDYRVGPGGWDESFAAMIKRLQEVRGGRCCPMCDYV